MENILKLGIALIIFSIVPTIMGCSSSDEETLIVEPSSLESVFPGNPISHIQIPQHPFLAPNGRSNMHNDAYMSDTYEISGPVSKNPQIIFRSYIEGPNTFTTIAFDTKDRLLTTNASMLDYSILLLDPQTLDLIGSYALPPQAPSDPLFPYRDTSGATYFILDNQDRILLTDAENAIQIIKYSDEKGRFEQLFRYDLSEHMVPMQSPARDHVQMAMPDWEGKWLWFTTRYGIVGTLDQETGEVHVVELNGEELQNSFAVAEDGVYIISDHAMYRFNVDKSRTPRIDWRTEYDRGTNRKIGNINHGSGTTPLLFGDLVAIGDNADAHMNILFLHRSDGSQMCKIPIFDEGRSTTENALPGIVREGPNGLEYSVIIDNHYGTKRDDILKPGSSWKNHNGGVARIDLLPDGKGGYTCREVWNIPIKSTATPKLSLSTGLLYLYTYERLPDNSYEWFMIIVDFRTGETVSNIPIGPGTQYANFGQAIFIGPDRTAYLGTMYGLVCIQDAAAM